MASRLVAHELAEQRLEPEARELGDDLGDGAGRDVLETQAGDVGRGAEMQQRDLRTLASGAAELEVHGDGAGGQVGALRRPAGLTAEVPGVLGAGVLKRPSGRQPAGEAGVVEHRRDVQQLGVPLQAVAGAQERAERVGALRVVDERGGRPRLDEVACAPGGVGVRPRRS